MAKQQKATIIRAAIYARKSSDDKKGDDQSPSVSEQIAACKSLAQKEGYEVIGVFMDDGISGRTPPAGYDSDFTNDRITNEYIAKMRQKTRPGFGDVCKLIQQGKVDILLCRDSTRIARPKFMSRLMTWIPELLMMNKVRVHSVIEGIWDAANQQQAMFGMIRDAMVDDEISKRAKLSIDAKTKLKRDGIYRGSAPFGYKKDGDNYVPDPKHAPTIKLMFTLRSRGRSFGEISQALAEKSYFRPDGKPIPYSYIRNIIDTPIYAGKLNIGTKESPDFIPAKNVKQIVSNDDYQKCDDLTRTNKEKFKNRPRAAGGSPLSGLVFCGYCGGTMSRSTTATGRKDKETGKIPYAHRYVCISRRFGGGCTKTMTILAEQLESFVGTFVALKTAIESARRKEHQQRKNELPGLLQEVEELRNKRLRLLDDKRLDAETLTVLAGGLGKQISDMQREIHEIESLPEPKLGKAQKIVEAKTMTLQEQRDTLRQYVKSVKVFTSRIEITLFDNNVLSIQRIKTTRGVVLPKINALPEENIVHFIIDIDNRNYESISGDGYLIDFFKFK